MTLELFANESTTANKNSVNVSALVQTNSLTSLEASTLFAEGSHAKTSATPGPRKAIRWDLTVSVRDSGQNSPELWASWNRDTSSWKTPQNSIFGDFSEFSETLPKSGMALNGSLYKLPPLVRLTEGQEHSLWRTPTARDGRGLSAKSWRERLKGDTTPTLPDQLGFVPHPDFCEVLMGFPPGWTDLGQSGIRSSRKSRKSSDAQSCKRKE